MSLSQKFNLIFPIISSTWIFRDLFNIIGLILFFSYIENFNLKNVNKLDKNREIISLYDNEKHGSIHTFTKF